MKKKYILSFILVVTAIFFINSYLKIEHNRNLLQYFSAENWLTEEERAYLNEKAFILYGADKNTPPLRFVNPDSGQYEGLVIDYLNALSTELGIKIQMKPMVWHEALEALDNGAIDICDMHASKERAERYIFTEPIYYQRGAILVAKNQKKIVSASDISGKKIAAIKDDYIFEHLSENGIPVMATETKDIIEAIGQLEKGNVEAVLGDESVINYYINQEGLNKDFKILNDYLYVRPAVIGINKSNDKLLKILNKAIRELESNHTMEKIHEKWFGVSPLIMKNDTAEKYKELFKYIGALSILLAFFFYYWNRELKNEVKKQTNALYISKNELETTFNGLTTHLMVVVNEDCRVSEANTAFCKGIGYSMEEVKNVHCKNVNGILGSDCETCLIKSLFVNRTSIEKEVFHNGRTFKVRTYLLDQLPDTKERVLVMMEDITDLKMAEQKMLQSSKMAAVGQLAAGIAHEIRTPLGIIRNYTYLLKRLQDESERKEAIETIENSVTRANKIIDNLLNFSRLSDNTIQKISVADFIDNIYELNKKALKENNIEFKLYVERNLQAELYSESLKHVMLNLFANATDAMAEGGILEVHAYQSANNIMIEVSDTGIGMSAATQVHLFDPFYTTKSVGEGTGLGLFIVYNEIEKMEGQIKVQSQLGEGSKFIITLPLSLENSTVVVK